MQRQDKASSVLIVFVTLLTLTIGSVASPVPVYAASTITVTTNADNTTTDTLCSLREAINNANSDRAASPDCAAGSGNDTIVFDPIVFPNNLTRIVLGSTLPTITDIDGLTIDGSNVQGLAAISGNSRHRVFIVAYGASLMLKNLEVSNGRSSGGSAVLNYETLTIDHSLFGGHVADRGGAILSTGRVTITNSIFMENHSTGSSYVRGGAILNDYGTLSIRASIFSSNNAVVGGAIYNNGGILVIRGSSFLDNDSVNGAIYNTSSARISNSTFTRNRSTDIGGAIFNAKYLTIWNSTFSDNSAISPGGGGDIYQLGATTTLDLYNNIFANSLGGGHCGNSSGTVSSKNNLIEDASFTCGLKNGVNGNITGFDPALAPMSDYVYFSSPPYYPLNPHSIAVDRGNDANCPATDQRGVTRPQGSHCDIGSYESP